MKILIIEDEPELLELTKNALEKERYVVEVAANYRQAMEKVGVYDYECILLDIMLPDGDRWADTPQRAEEDAQTR